MLILSVLADIESSLLRPKSLTDSCKDGEIGTTYPLHAG